MTKTLITKDKQYELNQELITLCCVETPETISQLKTIYQQGADLFFDNHEPLQTACILNNYSAARYLLEHKSDVNCNNGYCLTWSSHHGHLNIVKLLVAFNANIHIDNESPLYSAIIENKIEVVDYLLSLGADFKKIQNQIFQPVLKDGHITNLKISNNSLPILKTIQSHGYDLTQHNSLNLYYSLLYDELELANFLLEIGTQILISHQNAEFSTKLSQPAYELYQYHISKKFAHQLDNQLDCSINLSLSKSKI